MILTITKYLENLLRDSTLSLLSTVNFFFLGNQDDSKNAKQNLFKNHPIFCDNFPIIPIIRLIVSFALSPIEQMREKKDREGESISEEVESNEKAWYMYCIASITLFDEHPQEIYNRASEMQTE